ncbi:P-loop containing nucleoside triphosphate hydrolase protein [Tilletiaria anomala UBC 951]|uniref:Guanine nucleotide-binding protein-like 1 n=1 Tax=Tilletiaria anomala (strain ATCC 24038 / CBS 436.72 / UBC 951) TaxID=1037660 RepID=A0A066VDV8_TILAU|nr:P-loop containing nucleoside triphosphate hydrolase protein [Tilletiaria anomala UBC 951]KDN36770.1 P-loop containing nucleoside triphosphate hydrolase protein [Tilletiaria anomala UBC 951]
MGKKGSTQIGQKGTRQIAKHKRRQVLTDIAKREESSFAKLGPDALLQLNLHATYTVLARPIPRVLTLYSHPENNVARGGSSDSESVSKKTSRSRPLLTLPKKPRWSHELSAKAVQSNEAEAFRNWLEKTDEEVQRCFKDALTVKGKGRAAEHNVDDDAATLAAAVIPSLFERNLEVYQQLWRVVDRVQILLVLLDTRCPPIHLPPSLEDYLFRQGHTRRRRTVLVLTKVDLVTADVAAVWQAWLKQKYPQWQVVLTSSYVQREAHEGQGSRIRFQSSISPESRIALIDAIQTAYNKLVEPPEHMSKDPDALRRWHHEQSSQDEGRRLGSIDWDTLRNQAHEETRAGMEGAQASRHVSDPAVCKGCDTSAAVGHLGADLCIGLIGQPNVGKSSLINALLGVQKVRASKTPGKTKHYQTHLLLDCPRQQQASMYGHLSSRVMLCDSPGLVFPSLVGMEIQVLCGILQISQVQAAASCVEYAAHRLPLEVIYRLKGEGKRGSESGKDNPLTAIYVLEALATRYNFKTAKAGRADTNRAANMVLRALAEGRIKWAFRPAHPTSQEDESTEQGIWLRSDADVEEVQEGGFYAEDAVQEIEEASHDEHMLASDGKAVRFSDDVGHRTLSEMETGESDLSDVDEKAQVTASFRPATSMFAALQVEHAGDESSADEGD